MTHQSLTNNFNEPTTPSHASRLPALPALDGFRAIAILLVMISHASFGKAVPGGLGVTIFFFLSGYLITSILRIESDNTKTISLWKFYRKRTYRIIPPLFLTFAFLYMLMLFGILKNEITPLGIIADATFLTNYSPQTGIKPVFPIPLWSLDVEEHFYIVFSTMYFLFIARMSHINAFASCIIACGVILLVRLGHAVIMSDLSQIYYWTHTRIDSILFGSCLALWRNPALDEDRWRPEFMHFIIAVAVLLICLAVRNPLFRETIRYSLQGTALFVIFAYAINDRSYVSAILGLRLLKLIAVGSYTLYLIHVPAIRLAEQWDMPLPFAWAMSFSAFYAWAMYMCVEKPLARWSRRSKPANHSPSAAIP